MNQPFNRTRDGAWLTDKTELHVGRLKTEFKSSTFCQDAHEVAWAELLNINKWCLTVELQQTNKQNKNQIVSGEESQSMEKWKQHHVYLNGLSTVITALLPLNKHTQTRKGGT